MNRTNLYLDGENLSSPYLADIKKDVTVHTLDAFNNFC